MCYRKLWIHVRKTVWLDIYGSTIEGLLWQSFVVEVSMDYGRIEQRTRKTFTLSC
jgi:hypothetical protein